MASPEQLFRTYYYHCLPYVGPAPTREERAYYAAARRFIAALEYHPRFEVRLGRLAYQSGEYVQKRVDCMVSVDMALLAAKGKIHRAALFTGDSDLIPAIEAVKREGVLVTLWHGSGDRTKPSRELFAICDERRALTTDLFPKSGSLALSTRALSSKLCRPKSRTSRGRTKGGWKRSILR